jgi:phage terminase small subunit
MNIRERKTAENYVLNPETMGNAEQSCIKAGFSPRYARGHACLIVARSSVKSYINKLEEEKKAKLTLTIDKKLEMLTEAINAETPGSSMWVRLLEEHGKLSGHYTNKIDFRDKTDRTKQEKEELEGIRNRIIDANLTTAGN